MEVTRVTAVKPMKFEKGYQVITIKVASDDYRGYRIKAAELGVTVSDVCRLALEDDAVWKRAVKIKAQSKKKGGKIA